MSFGQGKKVYVGLSGGVDSAVSAALLKQRGYDVTGVFIRIAIPGYPCTAGNDKIDAQRVAAHLRIPFIEIDLSKEYTDKVFATMVEEFSKGHTPNPDTLCNQQIKFGAFYNFAKAHGADFIATGHYAQNTSVNNPVSGYKNFLLKIFSSPRAVALRSPATGLFTGLDQDKDQSYFLWMVPQEALANTIFPVGNLEKKEVRKLAEKFDLPNARRKDSQGLCFLGDVSIEDMLQNELAPVAGDVLNESGEVVGRHRGALTYTLGQRHGFELFEQTGQSQYVIAKDVPRNTITVSSSPLPKGATKTTLQLGETNWIGEVPNGLYQARFRYRQKLMQAKLVVNEKGAEVTLMEPHYAPVGQSLVLYSGDPLRSEARRCMGGGIIEDAQVS